MTDIPQPDIGDKVTFIDGSDIWHRALVVDACEDAPYITLATGCNGPLGEEYNHGTNDHSSVYPHTSTTDDPVAMEGTAFIPGWDAADDWAAEQEAAPAR